MGKVAGSDSAGDVKILNLSLGQDTGGQQMRLARAWRRYRPEDEYISVTSTPTFYEIENRLPQSWHKLLKDWWPNADIVHLNNDLNFTSRLRDRDRRIDLNKPMVIHHHGTMFRTRPEYHLEALHTWHATAICSTVDLHAIAPAETVWLPQAYELEELQGYREEALRLDPPVEGVLRIAHAPTNRPIKSTDALIEAVKRLRGVGVKVELDIIEKVKNTECLRRKARADVFVDQLLLGYGCNAIEAFGMGIPVIAGVQPEKCIELIRMEIPESTPELMLDLWGQYPFYSSTDTDLFHALATMLKPEVRKQYSERGMEHFLRFHHAPLVVEKLRSIYTDTIQEWEQRQVA